tara:strand:+ start:22 stop:168 length:147 start_codon:yes stop_codon:yes gene_type:complete
MKLEYHLLWTLSMDGLLPIYLKIVRWSETKLRLALLERVAYQELDLSK